MTSTLPPLIQAFAGGGGAAIANGLIYPIDLLCTRIQTQSTVSSSSSDLQKGVRIYEEIVREQGVKGLYSGLDSDTGATLIGNFLYYYAYSALRVMALREKTQAPNGSTASAKKGGMLSVEQELIIGFISGVVSRVVTIPLAVITVHLQSEAEKHSGGERKGSEVPSVSSVVRHIYQEQGVSGFWSGLSSTVILCLNPALIMLFFQLYRRVVLKGKDRERPTSSQGFIGGAISSSAAVILLYPLILAKARLQSYSKPVKEATILSVWNRVVRERGFGGLYQGVQAQIVKGFLGQGATLMTKQRLEGIIVATYHWINRRKIE